MPLYQYGCTSCAVTIERKQHFDDPPLAECPECGGSLRRILQPVGIIFKGSGWYSTDHRPKETAAESTCPADSGKSCAGAKECAAAASKN